MTDTVEAGKPLLEKLGWKWCRVGGSLKEEKLAGRAIKASRHEGWKSKPELVAECREKRTRVRAVEGLCLKEPGK